MRQKYGLYPSFVESKYRGYEALARQTALVGRLGPRPEKALEEIVGLAKEMTKSTNERQALEHFVGNGPEVGGMLGKQMGMLTGKSNRPASEQEHHPKTL
jgi:hypothetical protein